MTGILSTKGINIAIDGKGLRGGTEKIKGKKTPYILNAIDTATALVIAQLPIGEKENEMTAIPKLLNLLNINGSTITIDAVGTTSNIMDAIMMNEADYILTVKKNSPLTYQELAEIFKGEKTEQEQLDTYDVCKTSEKNRSRMEYRTVQTCRNTELVNLCKKREEIKTVAWLEQVRIPMEKDQDGNDITPGYEEFLKHGSMRKTRITTGDELTDDIHQVGLISSREMSAQEMLTLKRGHWKIENSLHHVLDDLFREDRSSARKSRNNLAILRKFAYNILRIAIMTEKQESGPTEMSDEFADDLTLVEKYVFRKLARI
jgi:predicted transposase YbfD/YdcC